jgi:hypothetical protein
MKRGIEKHVTRYADRLVNFIIGGTQKGGTSALHAYLTEHPEICMAEKKESASRGP